MHMLSTAAIGSIGPIESVNVQTCCVDNGDFAVLLLCQGYNCGLELWFVVRRLVREGDEVRVIGRHLQRIPGSLKPLFMHDRNCSTQDKSIFART